MYLYLLVVVPVFLEVTKPYCWGQDTIQVNCYPTTGCTQFANVTNFIPDVNTKPQCCMEGQMSYAIDGTEGCLVCSVILMNFHARQQANSIELTFTFSNSVSITANTPCFLNRLIFVSAVGTTRPQFPGTCRVTLAPDSTVVAEMDTRDYVDALRNGAFVTLQNTRLRTAAGMELGFLPGSDLTPITTPLTVTTFVAHVDSPSLMSFDLEWSQTSARLLLHFSDVMDMSNYDSEEATLRSDLNGMVHTLSRFSRAVGTTANLIKTICVTLSSSDRMMLEQRSICTSQFGGCSVSFTSSLASNYVGSAVLPGTDIPVSKFRGLNAMTTALRLSISYIDCDAEFSLVPDEVYIVREGEYINSVTCAGSALTYGEEETSFPEAMTRQDNTGISVSFPGGMPDSYLGLFTCVADGEKTIHYIVNTPTFIGIPNSPSTQLFDPLTIPFYFGSNPQLDLTNPNLEIIFERTASATGPSPPEPSYLRRSPYRAEVSYAQATFSISAAFTLRVVSGGSAQAMAEITLSITPPSVNITPSAATILPTDTRLVLQCNTNSPSLSVFWITNITHEGAQILGSTATLNYTLPPEGLADETKLFCSVRNPEDQSVDINNAVAETFAVVTNIPAPLSVFNSDGEKVTDLSTIPITNSNLTLRCLGHAPSGVQNLVWISEQDGMPTIVLSPEDNVNSNIIVSYGYNEANLTIVNLPEPYQGTLSCQSDSSGAQVTVFVNDVSPTTLRLPVTTANTTAAGLGSGGSALVTGVAAAMAMLLTVCDKHSDLLKI